MIQQVSKDFKALEIGYNFGFVYLKALLVQFLLINGLCSISAVSYNNTSGSAWDFGSSNDNNSTNNNNNSASGGNNNNSSNNNSWNFNWSKDNNNSKILQVIHK